MLETKELLNVEELATYLNCSTALIHKLKNLGKLPYIKIGSSIRFQKHEVLAALKENTNDNLE